MRPMPEDITQKYEQQLLNLELAVISFYEEHPELTDAQVDSVYEELGKRYRAEATAHEYRPGRLEGLRDTLHQELLPVAELLVGRPTNVLPNVPISAEEMTLIFKRLRTSIKTWQKRGGRQAYLEYVSQFMQGTFGDVLDDEE